MQSKATTVTAYLASLPADRRATLEAVRRVILKHKDADIAEGMQYGMIGYFVPHELYPPGYHCDPKQPLPLAGLASQKQHCSLYVMALYTGPNRQDNDLVRWFRAAWAKAGKQLDMGKACIRFATADDLALDVLAELFRRVTAKKYIAQYEANLAEAGIKHKGKKADPKTTPRPKPTAKKPAKKPATKKTAKRTSKQPARKKASR
ncbi:MAG: DUF1801 domain-containing protein [Planctomycetota bacterium]|nr:DUF1801 domain-containing protein [Planctomycetota bacterium]